MIIYGEYLFLENFITGWLLLLLTGRLDDYLADIDRQAEEIFARLVEQLAETDGINEELKADNQMEWVRRMNAIFEQAREIVNVKLIYTI